MYPVGIPAFDQAAAQAELTRQNARASAPANLQSAYNAADYDFYVALVAAGMAFGVDTGPYRTALRSLGTSGSVGPANVDGIQADIYLDFAGGNGYGATAANLSVTRASIGTNLLPVSAAGASFTTFAANQVRLTPGRGVLAEESRTNSFLLSSAPATQNISLTTGTTYTCWINGTGSMAVAAVAGAGTITGSPATNGAPCTIVVTTTGSFSFTPSGTLQAVQVEAGQGGSSYISTAGASVTRAADSALLLTPFPTLGSAYTVLCSGTPFQDTTSTIQILFSLDDGTAATNRLQMSRQVANSNMHVTNSSAGVDAIMTPGSWPLGGRGTVACCTTTGSQLAAFNGSPVQSGSGALPQSIANLRIGSNGANASYWNGWCDRIAVWLNHAASGPELQRLSAGG